MGRGTEMCEYLRAEKHPTALQLIHRYNYIEITPELKKLRLAILKAKREDKKDRV